VSDGLHILSYFINIF